MGKSIIETGEESTALPQKNLGLGALDSAEQPLIESLRDKTARAALSAGGADVITRVLTIVLSIATARALDPGEVGSLALAVIIIGIISMIASYAETAAVVCRSEGSDAQYALAATVIRSAITALLVAITLLALRPITRLLAGREGAEPQLAGLVTLLIWQPILELAGSYPRVMLQRRLDLTYLALVNLVQVVTHVGLSVAMLARGYGPTGVVWSSLFAACMILLMLWPRLTSVRVRVHETRSALSKIIWWQTALATANIFSGGFIGYINTRLDNLLVAGALGPTGMSFYAMAWNASRTPVLVFSSAFSSVLMPTMARIQEDGERVKRALAESLQHSYVLLAPVSMAMFLSAGSIVPVVLGAKWKPMIPCLQVMAITILLAPILYAWQALFIVTKRAYLTSIPSIAHIAFLAILMVPVTTRKGLIGAAFVDMIGVCILTLTGILLNSRLRAMLTWKVSSSVLAPIGSATMSGLVGYIVVMSLPHGIGRDTICVGAALLLYPFVLALLGGRSAFSGTVGVFQRVRWSTKSSAPPVKEPASDALTS